MKSQSWVGTEVENQSLNTKTREPATSHTSPVTINGPFFFFFTSPFAKCRRPRAPTRGVSWSTLPNQTRPILRIFQPLSLRLALAAMLRARVAVPPPRFETHRFVDLSLLPRQILAPATLSRSSQSLPPHFSAYEEIEMVLCMYMFIFVLLLNGFGCSFSCLDGIGSKSFRRVLTEEIPRLAYEMNRIESLRCYLGELFWIAECMCFSLCYFTFWCLQLVSLWIIRMLWCFSSLFLCGCLRGFRFSLQHVSLLLCFHGVFMIVHICAFFQFSFSLRD